jgi:hypothetical protein
MKVNSLKVIHWNNLKTDSGDLSLAMLACADRSSKYTLVAVRDVLNALGKELDKPGFSAVFHALSKHDTGDVFVALPSS